MNARFILPKIIATFTGKSRYIPDIQWKRDLWTYNIFRAYELAFGCRVGIYPQGAMHNGKFYAISFEAKVVHTEVLLRRGLYEFWKSRPRIVWIPVIELRPVFAGISSREQTLKKHYRLSIAFDNDLTQVTGAGTITQAYTVTGSNPYLNTQTLSQPAGTTTGVTYAGVSGAQVDTGNSGQGAGTETNYLFAHNAPATGSNNIVASFGGTSTTTTLEAASYSGCAQSGQPEAHGFFQSGGATSFSKSVVVLTANAWLIGGIRLQNTATAGSNTVLRPASLSLTMWDSGVDQTTGSQSLTATSASGYGIVFVTSVAPFVPSSLIRPIFVPQAVKRASFF